MASQKRQRQRSNRQAARDEAALRLADAVEALRDLGIVTSPAARPGALHALCERCDQPMLLRRKGKTRRYCSSACRQAAYRERKAAVDA